MLNTHPHLAVPRETRFLLEMYKRRRTFGDLRDPGNHRAAAEFIVVRPDSWFERFGVDPDLAMRRLMAAPPTLGSLIGTAFKLYAEEQGKSRWGDKRPTLVLYLPGIFDMFPDGQFVNVIRDPRSAVASMKKLGWYDGNVGPAVDLWLRCVRHASKAAQRYRPDQFHEVVYEHLTHDPERHLTSICRFLDLDAIHVDQMLKFHENVDEPESEYHNRLNEPVNPMKIRAWEDVLAPAEVAFVEQQCGQLMDRYGYERYARDVNIPAEIPKLFKQRRKLMLKREKRIARMRRRERHPITARLTAAQRRRHALDRVAIRVRFLMR